MSLLPYQEEDGVALSEIDRNLLERCLHGKPRAWEDFVDRFMGLVIHVVNHTARARSVRLSRADRDDLCAEVFLAIVKNDFAVLAQLPRQEQSGDLSDGRGPTNRRPRIARPHVGRPIGRRLVAAFRSVDSRSARLRSKSGSTIARKSNDCSAACKAPKPRSCGCIISKARATTKSAWWSACPKTASARSSAVPATKCAAPATIPPQRNRRADFKPLANRRADFVRSCEA